MALVGYSDSEGSDAESAPAPPKPATPKAAKLSFQKANEPRKIKVELPTQVLKEDDAEEERPIKKAKTGGGFGGFNSLLPAPKRTAEQAKKTGLGSGISFKTSANAAFSREPVQKEAANEEQPAHLNESDDFNTEDVASQQSHMNLPKPDEEVKVVGNAMRFKPLSVANKKKPAKKKIIPGMTEAATAATSPKVVNKPLTAAVPPPPKPKVSLFSVTQEETVPSEADSMGTYEPMMSNDIPEDESTTAASTTLYEQAPANANSLDAIASDLNLSAADRRRLFGRTKGGDAALNIANFDMDAEYKRNEEMRAAGEAVEHRAVKAIAPGKHSLQQLVSAASTQREALEDAWAQGKRNRGEAGSKYGW
ncbi:hypothetical protein MBLNU457_g2842t1 [Dothideomycetes sp. NU457]